MNMWAADWAFVSDEWIPFTVFFGGIFACDSVAALRKTCHCQA